MQLLSGKTFLSLPKKIFRTERCQSYYTLTFPLLKQMCCSFVNRVENKSVRAVHHLRAFLEKPVCECLVLGKREGKRENMEKLFATC